MIRELKEKIYKEKNKRLKRNRNLFLRIFLVVFFAGYLFFFSSNIWMPPDYNDIPVTSMKRPIQHKEREIQLLDWTYAPNQRKMEVEIRIENRKYDGMDTYEWTAVDKKKGMLKVEPIVELKDYVVLHIEVPSGWTIISLRMGIKEGKQMETVKLYTNKKAVKEVNHIEKLTLPEYMKSRLDKNIAIYERQIADLEKKIQTNKKKVPGIQDNIKKYEDEQQYETEQQKEVSNNTIATLETEIKLLQEQNDGYTKEITEYQERIERTTQRKEEYQ